MNDADYRRRQQAKVDALAKFGIPAKLTESGHIALDALAADITVARLTKREQKPRRVRPSKGRPC